MKWFVFALRVFAVMGVLFAVISGLITGAVADAVASGAIFGAIMAIVLTSLTASRLRGRRGVSLSTHQRAELSVPAPADAVRELTLHAISTLPATVTADDGSRITARTKAGWLSWGEIVSVELRTAESSTLLAIDSRPRLRSTMADYGRNHRNVSQLAGALRA